MDAPVKAAGHRSRRWAAAAALAAALLPAGARRAGAEELPLHTEWYRPAIESAGIVGLAVGDLDADGTNEIVTSLLFYGWAILERRGAAYEQIWASVPDYDRSITALRVARVGGEPIVLVGYDDGRLDLVDGVNRRPFRTITTSATAVRGLRVADIDGDPAPEAVFCDGDEVFRVDLLTGAAEAPLLFDCTDLAVGQVDNDAALEIAVANGGKPAWVLDAATGAIEWTNNLGFGFLVETGDLDGDGRDEIAGASLWNDGVIAWNGESRTILFSHPVFNLGDVAVGNVDADPQLEVLYGDAQSGGIHVLDGPTGEEDWAVGSWGGGNVVGLAVGQLDADPAAEIVWTNAATEEYLEVADAGTHLVEWRTTSLRDGFGDVGGADLDADGAHEIFFTAPWGYAVHDGIDKQTELEALTPLGALRMVTADATGSPQHELFFAGSLDFNAGLVTTDLAGNELWSVELGLQTKLRALAVADVDADGELEAVATLLGDLNGAMGSYLYVYDAATGALEWQSPQTALSWDHDFSLLRIANVDGDPALEAVVAAFGNSLRVVDLQTHGEQFVTADLDVVALDTPNLDGLGPAEILVGTSTGLIRTIDGSGAPTTVLGPLGTPVNSLVAHDFNGDATLDYVYACAGDVLVLDGIDGATLWSSEPFGQSTGVNDTIRVGDFDDDGETEILVALQEAVVMLGDDPLENGLLRDGFESGSLFKWAAD